MQDCADEEVRYDHMIYGCSDAHPVRETRATTAAVEQAIHVLHEALGTDCTSMDSILGMDFPWRPDHRNVLPPGGFGALLTWLTACGETAPAAGSEPQPSSGKKDICQSRTSRCS